MYIGEGSYTKNNTSSKTLKFLCILAKGGTNFTLDYAYFVIHWYCARRNKVWLGEAGGLTEDEQKEGPEGTNFISIPQFPMTFLSRTNCREG
ncbi:hypothetical protein C5167_032418 [Papaver somniferum]|uniref:Uncharacterized protein n=1 Tax=Papaver somniferum TaxID=3469 RepID=A0A4Y7KBJ2_PAPSO|nr:hypothetical protein C5167_032418 [Papaver somniferum]